MPVIQGHAKVSVESQARQEGFGKGKREKMQFKNFLSGLGKGSEKLYLTTQEVRIMSMASL